jgi:hypothetical protein
VVECLPDAEDQPGQRIEDEWGKMDPVDQPRDEEGRLS